MRTDDKSKKLTFPIPRSESHKITQLSSQIQWPFSIGNDGLFGLQRAFGSGVGDGTANGVGETGLICTSPSPYFKSQLLKACCHTENYTLSVTSILVSSSILQSENYREREHPPRSCTNFLMVRITEVPMFLIVFDPLFQMQEKSRRPISKKGRNPLVDLIWQL